MSPYIEGKARNEMDPRKPYPRTPNTGGELNYAISRLIDQYVRDHGLSYKQIEEILAACEGAKSEFYYRIARAYEDRKIAENGEVFVACRDWLSKLSSHGPSRDAGDGGHIPPRGSGGAVPSPRGSKTVIPITRPWSRS